MNDTLLVQLVAALVLWLPLCAVALAPLGLLLGATRRTTPRVGAVLVAGYLLLSAITGVYAYKIVPADYTRDHQLTRAPVASALGEQHGADLQYATAATLTAAERESIRARVAAERRAFRDDWLMPSAYGLVAPVLLLGWVGWRRRPHTSETRR